MRSRNGAITLMNCARPCMYSMYTVFCKRPLSPATLLVVTPAISESESQYSSSGEWVSEWVKMPSNRSYSLCKCRSCCGLQQWYMRAGPRRTQYVRPYRRSVSPSPPNCTSSENDFQSMLLKHKYFTKLLDQLTRGFLQTVKIFLKSSVNPNKRVFN